MYDFIIVLGSVFSYPLQRLSAGRARRFGKRQSHPLGNGSPAWMGWPGAFLW